MFLITLILFIGYLLIFYEIKYKIPYVPSDKKLIKKLFRVYPFEKGKIFIDLGSGDGLVVFEAAKNGLIAYGYEINPVLYYFSLLKKKIFKIEKANFFRKDLKSVNLKDADYIYLFLLPKTLAEIENKIFSEGKKESKVICLDFRFPNKNFKEKILDRFYIYEI